MTQKIAIIGGGFTGLSLALDLARAGEAVTLFEAEEKVGGLAAAFETDGEPLDRFYHHWFTSDHEMMRLVEELGLREAMACSPSRTGIWLSNRIHRLSTPMDLLRFRGLSMAGRLRLGLMTLRARRVSDWRALEALTAAEWLRNLGGEEVYSQIWEPLLRGKFGPYADDISAVWFWNKLKLRGGSRSRSGGEELAYIRGSFSLVAETMVDQIRALGGTVRTGAVVSRFAPEAGGWTLSGPWGSEAFDRVIATTALPLVAEMIADWAAPDYLAALRRIPWLANICLVLELDRPLSQTYWLNVTDADFPFVGVIEHTNFQSEHRYGGRHIVYLSRYLTEDDPLYAMDQEALLDFALPHLRRMFPAFRDTWVMAAHLWKARWAQPVVERDYSSLIPAEDTPWPSFHLCSMAQIYPEDRGTNYAVRAGRRLAARLLAERDPADPEAPATLPASGRSTFEA